MREIYIDEKTIKTSATREKHPGDAKMHPRERQSDGASGSNRFRVCKSWTQLYCGDRITIPISLSFSRWQFMFVSRGDRIKCEDDLLSV